MSEGAGVEALMGGVGGLAAAVCVATMAALTGSPVIVGAGVGDGGGESDAAGVGSI
ncbi:MAG: hypothetical protein KIS95_03090 [Anaerolineae bacterium]|uniref:hypothetical protein n=1 Tax=Promineifilum sp. TaxID=2664178 RepID=UPI001D3B5CF9|nr:hypothetical protein [Anaerolineales bacterium]MCB8936757.1 hypothetical protein [Promineifilum sp.]MCO5181843.1 hypothetical protein [Promineifilum sp.]MCW5846189.1 hypothetical protein [Anaerolineae bacterium]